MSTKGKKYRSVKKPRKSFKRAEEMARRPMPKPATDMGDRTKFSRHSKHKTDWQSEDEKEE